MSGGFIPVPSQVARSQSPRPTTVSSLSPLLSLSSRQEDRLRLHLDDRILSLERDERKQSVSPLRVSFLGR